MRRKPVLFLLGILAAILADYVVEEALLALGVSSRAAWIAGAASFAIVWGGSFWFTLHLPPRPKKDTSP
ncbi:MAG: hypothetical protein AB7M05_07120 [Alphaproteobacteria bacterium]